MQIFIEIDDYIFSWIGCKVEYCAFMLCSFKLESLLPLKRLKKPSLIDSHVLLMLFDDGVSLMMSSADSDCSFVIMMAPPMLKIPNIPWKILSNGTLINLKADNMPCGANVLTLIQNICAKTLYVVAI